MQFRHAAAVVAAASFVVAGAGSAGAAPTGSPASYRVSHMSDMNDGDKVKVVRWNPCKPITYRINPGALGAAGVAETRRAMAMTARASGLDFRYLGTSRFIPRSDREGGGNMYQADAMLVVGYATRRQTDFFGPHSWVVGTAQTQYGSATDSALQIDRAVAFTRTDAGLVPGFGTTSKNSSNRRGSVVLHEIGHALGLDHVADRTQIMYPTLQARVTSEFHRGDLAGLKKVGRPAGCIVDRPVPVPNPDMDGDGVADTDDLDPTDPDNPSSADPDGNGAPTYEDAATFDAAVQ